MSKVIQTASVLEVRDDFLAGIDVGGTKVQIVDTLSTTVWRYATADFPDLYALLDTYFEKMQARPRMVMVGMAGPRDGKTGAIKLTNNHWPAFVPAEAGKRYKGTGFDTANDMVVTTAGVLYRPGVDLITLKSGTPVTSGAKVIITISTGIGVAAAVWDAATERYTIVPSEAAHAGFAPKNQREQGYLEYLLHKHPYPSFELAIAGKYGIENLTSYMLASHKVPELQDAITKASAAGRPLGAVLLELATKGHGEAREAAVRILDTLGDMIGSLLRDCALAYLATGGIYLTGSVSLGLGEYLAQSTDMNARFVGEGATHSGWIKEIPIYLMTDPYIAAGGALALAQRAKS